MQELKQRQEKRLHTFAKNDKKGKKQAKADNKADEEETKKRHQQELSAASQKQVWGINISEAAASLVTGIALPPSDVCRLLNQAWRGYYL